VPNGDMAAGARVAITMARMRRLAIPLVLVTAVAVVYVIYVNSKDEPSSTRETAKETVDRPADGGTDSTQPGSLLERGKRDTPTPLEKHRWLSELERVLEREDVSKAYFYRQKIAEDIDAILADETLYRNLMAAIRKYAIETQDVERRKLLLPLLRVIDTDEAMALIEQEYYKALNDEERIFLVEAMADPRHSPPTAVPWIVDIAVNAEDENHRQLALNTVGNIHGFYEVQFEAAHQIYEASTRPDQRGQALEVVARSSVESEKARKWVRSRLDRPREQELQILLMTMDGWGTLEEAARVKQLANEFPSMAHMLREHARRMRNHRLAEMGKDELIEHPPDPPPAEDDKPDE